MIPGQDTNPLLAEWGGPFGIPPFDRIRPEHFLPALEEAIRRHDGEIAAIATSREAPTFENTVAALDDSGELLANIVNVFAALSRAETNEALQAVEARVRPLLASHADDVLFNEALFERIRTLHALHGAPGRTPLGPEEETLLQRTFRRFVRGGASLSPARKERLRAINAAMSGLTVTFFRNVLAETNAYRLVVESRADLAGLSEDQVAGAEEAARSAGLAGKWVFTLKFPSIWPFLKSSSNRELRRQILDAYTTRCSRDGETDNRPVFARIAALRVEKARLLGYRTWAELVLEERLAGTPAAVYELLERLWKPALERAKQEAAELQAVIDAEGGGFRLEPWDWRYYAEKVRKAKYAFDEETIRPYLTLDAVREGAFLLAGRLYGVTFAELGDVPLYDPDVKAYEVKEKDGERLGVLLLDFHPRPGKQAGAWCSAIREQWTRNGRRVTPVVSDVHNIARPVGGTPALLTPEEAEAMVFHEFGHALHALFSTCRFRGSGQSAGAIAPDFFELPSQLLENWVLEPELLGLYARHHETGEPMPARLIAEVRRARTFQRGFAMTEYLAAALLDMDWHTLEEPTGLGTEAFEKASLERWGLIPEIPPRYHTTYFLHVADDRYSAGYYSYAWSMALDADAFAAFAETGDVFDEGAARAFRELLSRRGGEDPAVLFRRFRGRDVDLGPLLRRLGFDDAAPAAEPAPSPRETPGSSRP